MLFYASFIFLSSLTELKPSLVILPMVVKKIKSNLVMTQNKERYFIAYAPSPKSEIWALGSAWLAFNAATNKIPEKSFTLGLPPEIHLKTVLPARKTGFNAILVAPFNLRIGVSQENLCEKLTNFSESLSPFRTCLMKVKATGNKIGIEPLSLDNNIQDLANITVRHFNHFRDIPPEKPINPKLKEVLTERQIDNLTKWGYPYYFEDFKFIMPLTGAVPLPMIELLTKNLQNIFSKQLSQGLNIDSLTLFKQENHSKPARMIRRFPLLKDEVEKSIQKIVSI